MEDAVTPPIPEQESAESEVDKENNSDITGKGKSKVDYEKRYLDYIKKLSEKKAKEVQEMEEERAKMAEAREKLKKLVLARANKLKQLKEASDTVNIAPKEEVKGVEGDDKKKLIEKGKLRKYFRSRYASLLNTLAEEAKLKKTEEEKKKKHQEEVHQKIKSMLGIAQVQGKVLQGITKPLTATEPPAKPLSATIIGKTDPPEPISEAPKAEPLMEIRKVSQTITTFKADGSIIRKNLQPKSPGEEKQDSEEKKRLAKEAAEKIVQRQQQYLQQMAERKLMKEKQKEEEKEKKEKALKKLVEKAKVQIHELHENYHKEEPKPEQPPKKQLTKQEVEKITKKFLARNKSTKKPELNITDFAVWKKRNKVPEGTKVFIVTGGYGDIKRALKTRGWIENKTQNSLCFDFKWTIGTKEIDYGALQDFQIVNHFDKNGVITTKVGLCHHLRDLIWYSNVDVDTFYPRCFDLVDTEDTADFIEEFKNVKAEGVLKEFSFSNGKLEAVGEERLLVALNICERRLRDLDDILDDHKAETKLISPEEWEVLSSKELTADMLAKKKHEAWLKRIMKKYNRARKSKKKSKTKKEPENPQASPIEPEPTEQNKALLDKVNQVLSELKNKFPQYALNGYHNIWIVKPAGLSRGRGIRMFNNLTELLDYGKCREQQYVVQKYIENPMIIKLRKFDIRQWVLVTSLCPLTIWYYEECYVRFGAMDYHPKDFANRYMHLTNNSVTKHYEGEGGEIEGNMWDQATFQEYLKETYGSDVFEEKIKPAMQKIVQWSLECVQDSVINRKKSFEIFGYDFMIDEECNPWLIEINTSPAMDYSTAITERLVKKVSEDLVKVVVDYYKTPKKHRADVDTGDFTLLHKGKKFTKIPMSCGLNLVCEGKKIKR